MEFLHIGVPTKNVQPNETFVEGMNVYITDPEAHEYKYEYLRFAPNSCLPGELQVFTHIAFKVPSIAAELKKCDEVLVPITAVSDSMSIAFAKRDGVYFEFVEMK